MEIPGTKTCGESNVNSDHKEMITRKSFAIVSGLVALGALLFLAYPSYALGTEGDTVAPEFVSARTDGEYVIVTFSEDITFSPLV